LQNIGGIMLEITKKMIDTEIKYARDCLRDKLKKVTDYSIIVHKEGVILTIEYQTKSGVFEIYNVAF